MTQSRNSAVGASNGEVVDINAPDASAATAENAANNGNGASAAVAGLTMVNKNDLDSSNVLYDADFEIEEEKVENDDGSSFVAAAAQFHENASNLFNP